MRNPSDDRNLRMQLSDLYLDTEVRPGLVHAATAIVDSGYSRSEVDQIWRWELTPILHWNLLSVAGEWALFPIDWLEAAIRARRFWPTMLLTRVPGLGALLHRARAGFAQRDYEAAWRIAELLSRRPEKCRAPYVHAAYEILALYFSDQAFWAEHHAEKLRALAVPGATLDSWFEELEPIAARLLLPAAGELSRRRARAAWYARRRGRSWPESA